MDGVGYNKRGQCPHWTISSLSALHFWQSSSLISKLRRTGGRRLRMERGTPLKLYIPEEFPRWFFARLGFFAPDWLSISQTEWQFRWLAATDLQIHLIDIKGCTKRQRNDATVSLTVLHLILPWICLSLASVFRLVSFPIFHCANPPTTGWLIGESQLKGMTSKSCAEDEMIINQ